MKELRYTLLSDGASDRALIPLLTWLLREHNVKRAIQSNWADLRQIPEQKKPQTFPARICLSLELFPCDLLFVHRDAERESHSVRVTEIREAIDQAEMLTAIPPAICVVPIHMQEAWLLFDKPALRRAAGNPNGRQALHLPDLSRIENHPDPKTVLRNLLRQASGLKGRRLSRLRVSERVQLVSTFIPDFSPLRVLPAFNSLEAEIEGIVQKQNWNV